MKKTLLTVALLATALTLSAQNAPLMHVDQTAVFYVGNDALVYNGGGLQTKGTGVIDNHGNIMVSGVSGDVLKTLTAAGGDKLDGGNIILRANDVSSTNPNSYGQLFISGLSQGNISGIVNKEFKADRHGNGNYFQQIAMPFYNKQINSLSAEFGKTFSTQRWTQNEILKYDHSIMVSKHYTDLNELTTDATGYYMLGSKNDNLRADTPPASLPTIAPTATGSVFTLSGKPYAEVGSIPLQNAGNGVVFGGGGYGTNMYNEYYNSYIQDQFESTNSLWAGSYGRNIYQFGNPYFTNLDLSKIGYSESTGVTDGNAISNIWGVRYSPGTVTTLPSGSTYSTNALIQTFSATGIPVGDIGLMIKPMQTFVIKLRNNNLQNLNFNTIRRFKDTTRAAATDYDVTASKNTATATYKQLGVIALNSAGQEVGRTYYVVSPTSVTGHQTSNDTTVQAGNSSSNLIGTFEEDPINGMFDSNYTGQYWLYINEANEVDFFGKYVPMVLYGSGLIQSLKFEIRENAELIPAGQQALSSGIGFYYRTSSGTVASISQGQVVPVSGTQYGLSYGNGGNGTLGTVDQVKPSRTKVILNTAIDHYVVQFDPNWKKADIKVYDMSGKLVISKDKVTTTQDFVIELDKTKAGYVVTAVSDSGEKVNAKILR